MIWRTPTVGRKTRSGPFWLMCLLQLLNGDLQLMCSYYWSVIALQHCVSSAVQSSGPVLCGHVSPPCGASLPPSPSSPSHPVRPLQSTRSSSLCYRRVSHSLSMSHMVVFTCPCSSLSSSHPLLLSPCSCVCSLRLHLYSCPENSFIFATFLDSTWMC